MPPKQLGAQANPEKAAKMEAFFANKLPEIDWESIEQKANVATRVASSTVLGVLADQVETWLWLLPTFPTRTRLTVS